jgi:hypothetical protein
MASVCRSHRLPARSPCSFGLSATSQQYFCLRTNQHRPSATLNLAPRARCRSCTSALIVILAWCGMSPSVSFVKLHELSIVTLHSARALLSSLASPKDVVGRVFNADRPDQTDGVRYWFTSPVRSETRQIRISNQIPYTDRLNRYIGPVRPVSNRLNKKTELVDNLTCFHI